MKPMEHTITIKDIQQLTHDVLHFVTEKPKGYSFTPGQATELAINKEGLKEEKRPFTFTSLPDDENLEFVIKMYPSHDGVTDKLSEVRVGETFIIGDAWGAIEYKGKGTFIAGGAGITPFIAILKDLHKKQDLPGHRLYFGNKTAKDIFYESTFKSWLGDDYKNVLSEEDNEHYRHGHIDKDFIASQELDTNQKIYLCGPPPMMESVAEDLKSYGFSEEQLVTEDLD